MKINDFLPELRISSSDLEKLYNKRQASSIFDLDTRNLRIKCYSKRVKREEDIKISKVEMRNLCEDLSKSIRFFKHPENDLTNSRSEVIEPTIKDFLKVSIFYSVEELSKKITCKVAAAFPNISLQLYQVNHLNFPSIPIVKTLLEKFPSESKIAPETGFLTFDQENRLVPLQSNDQNIAKYPLVGIWTSGIEISLFRKMKHSNKKSGEKSSSGRRKRKTQNSPQKLTKTSANSFALAAIMRFLFSEEIKLRLSPAKNAELRFLFVEFSRKRKAPRFLEFHIKTVPNPWILFLASSSSCLATNALWSPIKYKLTSEKAIASMQQNCSLYKLYRVISKISRKGQEKENQPPNTILHCPFPISNNSSDYKLISQPQTESSNRDRSLIKSNKDQVATRLSFGHSGRRFSGSSSRSGSYLNSIKLKKTITEQNKIIFDLQHRIQIHESLLRGAKSLDSIHTVQYGSDLNTRFNDNMANYQKLNIGHNFNQVSPSFMEATEEDINHKKISRVNQLVSSDNKENLPIVCSPSNEIVNEETKEPVFRVAVVQSNHTQYRDSKVNEESRNSIKQKATRMRPASSLGNYCESLSVIKEANESVTSPENDPQGSSKDKKGDPIVIVR